MKNYDSLIITNPTTLCQTLPLRPNSSGYIYIWVGSSIKIGAHIYYYERKHGKIPIGLEPNHICRNRKCINAEHMRLVTHKENCRIRSGYNIYRKLNVKAPKKKLD